MAAGDDSLNELGILNGLLDLVSSPWGNLLINKTEELIIEILPMRKWSPLGFLGTILDLKVTDGNF